MKRHHDLLVIGAGMAGVAAANKAADGGWSVAIVDDLPYGGTCALRGCDPKKILRRGAEILDSAHLLRGKGIDAGGLAINWSDLMKHKHGFTDPVPANMESGLASRGVDLLHGRAVFTGPQDLDIDGMSHTAEHVLVATGAAPRPLDFPGHERLIDSTEFLDLESLPARILFVGGGFISFEFAHIAARAGSKVTIVHRGERPLKGFDPDLVERVVARGLAWGIDVRTSTSILAVEAGATGELVTLESNGVRESFEADLVVHGAGRVPALDGLGLEAAGVDYGLQGVRVEPYLRSVSNPAVWAAGDAADTAGMALTPVAVSEAKVAASNMLKQRTTAPDHAGIPTAVFTIPELTRVGLLEQEARDRNIDLDVRFHDTSGWYSNYRIGETTAAAKVLVDRSTDLIVGAHLLGPEYAELINPIGLAIKLGLTTRQLKSATAAYPSVGSDLDALL